MARVKRICVMSIYSLINIARVDRGLILEYRAFIHYLFLKGKISKVIHSVLNSVCSSLYIDKCNQRLMIQTLAFHLNWNTDHSFYHNLVLKGKIGKIMHTDNELTSVYSSFLPS